MQRSDVKHMVIFKSCFEMQLLFIFEEGSKEKEERGERAGGWCCVVWQVKAPSVTPSSYMEGFTSLMLCL